MWAHETPLRLLVAALFVLLVVNSSSSYAQEEEDELVAGPSSNNTILDLYINPLLCGPKFTTNFRECRVRKRRW